MKAEVPLCLTQPGDTWRISNPRADQHLLHLSNATDGSLAFNGDDAVALARRGAAGGAFDPVDAVGAARGGAGWVAGKGWEVLGVEGATTDHTLVRAVGSMLPQGWACLSASVSPSLAHSVGLSAVNPTSLSSSEPPPTPSARSSPRHRPLPPPLWIRSARAIFAPLAPLDPSSAAWWATPEVIPVQQPFSLVS